MASTQTCFKCKVTKDMEEFQRNQKQCRACFKVYARTKREADIARIAETPDNEKTCIKCENVLPLNSFTAGKSSCKQCIAKYELLRKAAKQPPKEKLNNIDEESKTIQEPIQSVQAPIDPVKAARAEKKRQYRQENRERICANKKEYYQKNKEHIRKWHEQHKEKRNARLRERRRQDRLNAAINSMRARLSKVLNSKKDDVFYKFLGCTRQQLRCWLEYQFTADITWQNYAEYWHIDHVVPIRFFDIDNAYERQVCFHWTNLKPLNKDENLAKCDKIVPRYIVSQAKCIKKYMSETSGYQATYESMWWPRFELGYGNNPTDEKSTEVFLKRVIRSQNPNPANDKGMDEVQRLDGDGSEESSQLL